MGYTLISGFIVGSFLVYLSSSQQVFQEQYGLKDAFPYIFAGLAIAVGSAIFLNATLVIRYGMRRIVNTAIVGYFISSLVYVILFFNTPNPPISVLITFFAIQFFAIGFLFGNLRALAMEPVGCWYWRRHYRSDLHLDGRAYKYIHRTLYNRPCTSVVYRVFGVCNLIADARFGFTTHKKTPKIIGASILFMLSRKRYLILKFA